MKIHDWQLVLGPDWAGKASLHLALVVECPVCEGVKTVTSTKYEIETSRRDRWEAERRPTREAVADHVRNSVQHGPVVCAHCGVHYSILDGEVGVVRDKIAEIPKSALDDALARSGMREGKATGRTPQGGLAGGDEFTYTAYLGGQPVVVASASSMAVAGD